MSDSDYPLISCLLCKSKTLWNICMMLGGTGPDDMSCTRITTLAFLFLELSPFFSGGWGGGIFRLLCNWNTLQNILMVHCRTVE